MSRSSEARKFADAVAAIPGVELVTGRSHTVVLYEGRRIGSLPISPSDWRSLKNCVSQLRRAGVPVDDYPLPGVKRPPKPKQPQPQPKEAIMAINNPNNPFTKLRGEEKQELVFEWADPPPRRATMGLSPVGEHINKALRTLADNPGRWSIVRQCVNTSTATSTGRAIRLGRYAGAEPGEYEATVRGTIVYARYVGDPELAALAEEEYEKSQGRNPARGGRAAKA